MKTRFPLIALLAGAIYASEASALDFLEFTRGDLLNCIHPTVNAKAARIEFSKEPVTEGETTLARVRVFYKGWIQDNSMLIEIEHRRCGSINEVRARVLEDSGTGRYPLCRYLEGWQDVMEAPVRL